MSTLWTPDGERPVGPTSRDTVRPDRTQESQSAHPPSAEQAAEGGLDDLSPEELEAEMAKLRDELARTPAAAVVANHCYGLFELARLHLSLSPPQLDEAKVAIDALGGIIDALVGRLGDVELQIQEGLAQMRLAFVQIRAAVQAAADAAAGADTGG